MLKKIITAVAAGALTAVVLCLAGCGRNGEQSTLKLYNTETGKVYRTFEVCEGTEFSVEFIHSVNQSPVKDVFVVKDKKIYADRTVYSAFGAGVQTELEDGQRLEYDENGNMVVSGFDIVFLEVKYIVGTVSDHVLCIGEECISLTALCGKNAHVAFVLK